MNVTELKELHPKRFEKEYEEWCEHEADDDWWTYIQDWFQERHAPQGVTVNSIQFSLYGQGSGAAFNGSVDIAKFMEHAGLHEKYLPLYLACKNDGSYCRVRIRRGFRMDIGFEGAPGDTAPSGVFADLDDTAWSVLVTQQFDESSLEDAVEEFCNDICDELHTDLEKEYDHITSEEAFIESCEANQITFEIETEET